MSFKSIGFSLLALLILSPFVFADQTAASSSNNKSTLASQTPASQSTPASSKKGANSAKVLVVHKPMASPSWGRVISYHKTEIFPLSDSNREILHEFLFQDDQGIVRTAVYHESASGDSYWEVTVWDQP